MASVIAQHLGTFKTGEIPLPLTVRFDDHNGTQLNIATGYTAAGYWTHRTEPHSGQLTVTIDTATNPLGVAVATLTAAMLANPGSHLLEVWVGNTTTRLASATYSYTVTTPIATTPPDI